MPDRPRGYVRRGEGALESGEEMAGQYARNARFAPVLFDARIQQMLIDAAREAAGHQEFRLHCVGTEPTHVHVLVSWIDDRSWQRMRAGLKQSLTRGLNRALLQRAGQPAATCAGAEDDARQPWFSRSASRKRVRDRAHFDYLVTEYLPSHRGAFWREDQ